MICSFSFHRFIVYLKKLDITIIKNRVFVNIFFKIFTISSIIIDFLLDMINLVGFL